MSRRSERLSNQTNNFHKLIKPLSKRLKKSIQTIPPELWCYIYDFLREFREFKSIYAINKRNHEYKGWQNALSHIEFRPRWDVSDLSFFDFSYVHNLNFTILRLPTKRLKLVDNMEGFARLKNVKRITFGTLGIRSVHLGYLKNVEAISMSANSVSDQGLIPLKNLKSLELILHRKIGDYGLKFLPHLESLRLIWADIIGHGFEYLPKLKKLVVHHSFRLLDEHFHYLEKLEDLELVNCSGINGSGLEWLKSLKVLTIVNCHIGNDVLHFLPKVEEITLRQCVDITDVGIEIILKHKRTVLNIAGCEEVSDKMIFEASKRIPKIIVSEERMIALRPQISSFSNITYEPDGNLRFW
jgi:hypothetical protein